MSLDPIGLLYLAASAATLIAALLPKVLGRVPVSMPMVFVAAGMGAFALFPDLPDPDPMQHSQLALHLTELCVIVSLMGAGLAINRRFAWRTWSTTWRLLAITMPLSIVAVTLLGWWGLGLGVAGAVLLAAALAPTDPVLASEVQVSEPLTDDGSDDDEARFAVTSEAGLNDGLAFPFTYAAIAISVAGLAPAGWLGQWLLLDVVWRLGVGVAVGLGAGWMLRRLFFSSVSRRLGFTDRADGFVALGATFLAYGAAEVAEGYGFVAVFVCACTIRAGEHAHGLHAVLHTFVEQVERLLTVVVLLLLGGAVSRGLLEALTVPDVLFAATLLLIIRPLAGWIGLTPGKTGPRERSVIAFFGVRGVGSLFYIAYALENGSFPEAERLWAIVAAVILGSVLLHGVAATPTMALLDRARRRRAAERGRPDGEVDTPV